MIRLRSNLLHHFFEIRFVGRFFVGSVLYNKNMSKENKDTLEAYEKYADKYFSREIIDGTCFIIEEKE